VFAQTTWTARAGVRGDETLAAAALLSVLWPESD